MRKRVEIEHTKSFIAYLSKKKIRKKMWEGIWCRQYDAKILKSNFFSLIQKHGMLKYFLTNKHSIKRV